MSKVEKYSNVVANANLAHILLRESKFKIIPEYYESNLQDVARYSFHATVGSMHYDKEDLRMHGEFDFRVNVKKGNKNLLDIKACYVAFYEFTEIVDAVAANEFCERVGLFSCYPFFRQHVASINAEADANLPMIPLLRQSHVIKK